MKEKLAIGSDHAGFNLKSKIMDHFADGFEWIDVGCNGSDSVDYPDFGHAVGQSIENKVVDRAIVICGSGNGINITVNKHKGVRSALCWNTEVAELARLHNDANVLAIPARFLNDDAAFEIVKVFLNTHFEGGRHLIRINKIEI